MKHRNEPIKIYKFEDGYLPPEEIFNTIEQNHNFSKKFRSLYERRDFLVNIRDQHNYDLVRHIKIILNKIKKDKILKAEDIKYLLRYRKLINEASYSIDMCHIEMLETNHLHYLAMQKLIDSYDQNMDFSDYAIVMESGMI